MNLLALVLEDDKASLQGLAGMVERDGFKALSAGTLKEAREFLRKGPVDVIVLDVELPDGSGLDLLRELADHPDADVVIVSGTATLDEAVHAMHEGAVDVLGKPIDSKKLRKILAEARRKAALRREIGELRGELKSLGRFGRLVGKSAALRGVYDLIASVAPTTATVLITGETGTGKELVAASVHELSRRAKAPFVPLNCGAVAPTLIESELFGHEKGSFTGATKSRKGVFERADGGTLFLDEVTEMSAELQVRLLRVLETHEITRIGGDETIPVDVRVIAATNRDPQGAIREGELREDLFFRLNVFQIPVPPLRQRGSDTVLLAHHFLEELNREAETAKELTEGSLRKIRSYDWPGNVRELRNAVERAFIVATDVIEPRHFRLGSEGNGETESDDLEIIVGMSIAEAERRLILATLDEVGGNRKSAAGMLGISLKTLYNRLSEYTDAETETA
jgi:DNA-binding NtrC family response regulator